METEYSIHEYLEYQTELNALVRPLPNTLDGNWTNLGWTGDCNLLDAISGGGCDDCSMQEVDCSWATCRDLPGGAITVLFDSILGAQAAHIIIIIMI